MKLIRKIPKTITNIFVTILIIGFMAVLSKIQPSTLHALPTPASSTKAIRINDLPLREIWRWTGIVASSENNPPKIIVKDNLIILAAAEYTGGSANQSIIVFDAKTGEQIWKSRPVFRGPDSIAVDNERVYVSYLDHVQAFDLKTGEILWIGAQQDRWKRGGLNVYLQHGQVEVYDLDITNSYPPNSKLFILDPQTGYTWGVEEWGGIFFHEGNLYYSSPQFRDSYSNWLGAKRREAKFDVLWRIEFEGAVRRWPIIANKVMYLDAYDIYALSPETGEIYWQYRTQSIIKPEADPTDRYYHNTNCYIPKMAYGANLIYVIRSDASVVGLDSLTGQEIGKMQFSPTPNYFDNDGHFQNMCHLIAASDKFVAVYFGDSQELIVFEQGVESNEN